MYKLINLPYFNWNVKTHGKRTDMFALRIVTDRL